jgi:LuxR family maltose regulon positive regulatory protein
MKLISSKITIPQDAPLITRQRLLDVLDESLASGSSTVVSGRAGTGKTIMSTDFARRSGRRVAWYKVDAPEVDLNGFIEYLVASVARECPGFGERTLARRPDASGLAETPGPAVTALVETFIYELEKLAEPLLLVFDDLHLVYDAVWVFPFFQRLLTLLPADTHALIQGRGLPPAPLWRLRSKQRLCVIGEPMLAFTQSEAEALFVRYGLDAQLANSALQSTGGRAAAMHAAAMRTDESFMVDCAQ